MRWPACRTSPATSERTASWCSTSPAAASDTPVSAMPNAGLPQFVDGRFLYLASPAYFADFAARAVALGVRLVGGCCGTTPDHIRHVADEVRGLKPRQIPDRPKAMRLAGLEPFELA